MLSEERKMTIRTEELYRETVRRELEAQNPPAAHPSRFWKFLNSSLGIWFLSTCMLGGATFGFTAFSETQKASREKLISINRLDTEITARLNAVHITKNKKVSALSLLSLEEPEHSEFPMSIFPEYKSRTFRSLLHELHSLIPAEEKQEIRNAIDSTRDWHRTYKHSKSTRDGRSGFTAWANRMVFYVTIAPLNLKRWDFPFSDYISKNRSGEPTESVTADPNE